MKKMEENKTGIHIYTFIKTDQHFNVTSLNIQNLELTTTDQMKSDRYFGLINAASQNIQDVSLVLKVSLLLVS